jgi:predicted DNA binding CopG/RHH family protein
MTRPHPTKARRGRPPLGDAPRRAVTLRVDAALLERLRTQAAARGIGYQTLIHEVLTRAASRR